MRMMLWALVVSVVLVISAGPAWACDPSANNPMPNGANTYAVTTLAALGLTSGSFTIPSNAAAATVQVSAGDIAVSVTGTPSATDVQFGTTSPNASYFELCGQASIQAFRMIGVGGTATVKAAFWSR